MPPTLEADGGARAVAVRLVGHRPGGHGHGKPTVSRERKHAPAPLPPQALRARSFACSPSRRSCTAHRGAGGSGRMVTSPSWWTPSSRITSPPRWVAIVPPAPCPALLMPMHSLLCPRAAAAPAAACLPASCMPDALAHCTPRCPRPCPPAPAPASRCHAPSARDVAVLPTRPPTPPRPAAACSLARACTRR